jgi:hypothetical protein
VDQQPFRTKEHCLLRLNRQPLPTAEENEMVNMWKTEMLCLLPNEIISQS